MTLRHLRCSVMIDGAVDEIGVPRPRESHGRQDEWRRLCRAVKRDGERRATLLA